MDQDAATAEVWEILRAARKINRATGLTGGLFASSAFFAQILEGPADAVEDRFGRIAADPRHRDLLVIQRETVAERLHPTWAMGLASFEPADSTSVNGLLEQLCETPGDRAALVVRKIIESSVGALAIQ